LQTGFRSSSKNFVLVTHPHITAARFTH